MLTSTRKAMLVAFLAAILVTGCSSEEAGTNNQQDTVDTQQTDEGQTEDQANTDENQPDEGEQPENGNETEGEADNQSQVDSTNQEDKELTKDEAAEILQEYEDTFLVETSSDGTVKNYETKEELLSHFTSIMSEELAQNYADEFFRKENGQLKLIATEPPVWLDPEMDYQLDKQNDTTYHVTQSKNSELRGDRKYTFQLTYKSNHWIVDNVTSEKSGETEKTEAEQIKEKANAVLDALLEKDMETLAGMVHPEKGLLISPYVNLSEEDIVLDKQEVARLDELNETYTWGYEAGSGKPIKSTPQEYFQRYQDFSEVDEIIVDDIEQRGNVTMNIKEYLLDSHVVEFYKDGTEENANMDWSSLYIVFQKDSEGEWVAVALVSGQWTI
ncbi:hypothetical protein V1502_02770 [Bacillus sp. SCS-153A]|uniref:hypothetical protein n=1 Tax=Rossellomorea sedimentorum TaxID=3115294 RepID=UPI003906AC9A